MNAKGVLQEALVQCYPNVPLPRYSSYRDETVGSDHEPAWNGRLEWRGETHVAAVQARTRKQADQCVAQLVYDWLFPLNASPATDDVKTVVQRSDVGAVPQRPIVYVDADHIAFVTSQICESYADVCFRFYYNKDATLAAGVAAAQTLNNVEFFEAPQPVKNLADTMILFDLARQDVGQKAVVVSKDAIFYNATLLLENVTRVGTLNDLIATLV